MNNKEFANPLYIKGLCLFLYDFPLISYIQSDFIHLFYYLRLSYISQEICYISHEIYNSTVMSYNSGVI